MNRVQNRKATEPPWEDSLFLSFKSPEVPGTRLLDFGGMKRWVDHTVTQWFSTQDP